MMENNLERLKSIAKKKNTTNNPKMKPIVINTSIPTKSGVDITERVENLYNNLLRRA
ncbi:MAG: hypothetical protein E6583_00790 [Clostridium sp.]|nr:hypothetical protein [Clostridium sp.]